MAAKAFRDSTIHFLKLNYIVLLMLFACISILPLLPDYTWISTMVLLPVLAIYLFLSSKSSNVFQDYFFRQFFLLLVLAIASRLFVKSTPEYIYEIRSLLGTVIISMIVFFVIKRNIDNLWFIYLILVLKFLFMVYYTYTGGAIMDFDAESSRLQTGAIVGINANSYGYFGFISIFALGILMINYKNLLIRVLLFIVIIISFYINILAASRAGIFFSVFASVFVYLALTYKSIKGVIVKSIFLLFGLFFVQKVGMLMFENYIIIQRFNSFAESGEDERIVILKNGLDIFVRNPWGLGAGQFHLAMAETDLGKVAASHNSFLLVASNYGVLALVVFVNLFYLFFRDSIFLLRSSFFYIQRQGVLFISFGVLFFFYNFFYDMIINLYIISMFALVYYHQKSIVSKLRMRKYY